MANTKEQEAKKEYDAFLDSGDLKILFKGMSGDWEKDKKVWIRIWENNQAVIDVSTKKPNNG